jgi:arginase
LSDTVASAIYEGYTPVILGGDHSLGIGSVSGTVKATKAKLNSDIGLIWIDAHADINTPLTSNTGNLHGQPVSFLVHELHDYVPKLRGYESINSW